MELWKFVGLCQSVDNWDIYCNMKVDIGKLNSTALIVAKTPYMQFWPLWVQYGQAASQHWRTMLVKILWPNTFKKGCCQLQAIVCARITGYPLVQACPGKSVVRWTDRPVMTTAVDLGRKATKQTNKLAQCRSRIIVNSAIYWCVNDKMPRSAVGNVSGYRCESDCRSRGREFDPGLVPYFRGDWSWNDFYGHSPPFRWIIQEGLLSATSESICTKYWLTACSSLPRKKCG